MRQMLNQKEWNILFALKEELYSNGRHSPEVEKWLKKRIQELERKRPTQERYT